MKKITKIVPVLFLLALAACQDHHFVPMDKAEKMKFPKQSDNAKSFNNDEAGKKYVMTDEYRQPDQKRVASPAQPQSGGRLIAKGVLSLGDEIAGKNFSSYTVYIIVWNKNQQGPPTAVVRYSGESFPIAFKLEEKDLMAGGFPEAGAELRLEARLDADGDVMSKVKGDYYGVTSTPLSVGVKGVTLVINQAR